MKNDYINVIGAGLAGVEAAWQIAQSGIKVRLFEMKAIRKSPAHESDNFAELVCSNSLKAARVESAAGLLKEEMRRMNSLLMKCADSCTVPAGGALAVDRDDFSKMATKAIKEHPLIEVISEEVKAVPKDAITIVCAGPLCDGNLAEDIKKMCEGSLSFYDAAAPIVSADSLDMSKCFKASRYEKGDDDYINCPMNKEEYLVFYNELINAQRAPVKGFEASDPKVYEGCMPVEVIASRGVDTLRFGPLKPVGLTDPRTGRRPWAVVQLRTENKEFTLYNLVGFQTNLKFGEQKRVFGLIPGLENAEFMRYGVMHRNTFINSPKLLNADYSLKSDGNIFFAGQITGVEGYMESASSGIMAGVNAVRRFKGEKSLVLSVNTMTGALANNMANSVSKNYQPMGANFGVLPPIEPHIRDKKLRYAALAQRALQDLENAIEVDIK